jgi:hypothetical protein
MLLPTVVIVAGALVLMSLHASTRVMLDVSVSRFTFTVGGSEAIPLITALPVQAVTFERYARATFNPEQLEMANPARPGPTDQERTDAAWTPLAFTPPVLIAGEDEALQPALTFDGAATATTPDAVLGPLWIKPGSEVTIEVRSLRSGDPTIRVTGQPSSTRLSFEGPFQIVANYAKVDGIAGIPSATRVTYRAKLRPESRFVEITGQPGAFVVAPTLPSEGGMDVYPKGIPVTALGFTRQGTRGAPETALTGPGEISYPDYPALPKLALQASDFVSMRGLSGFRIDEIANASNASGLRLRLSGVARELTSGSPAFPTDHRLTWFDILWQSSRLLALFAIGVWVLSTTIGGYRLSLVIRGESKKGTESL